MIRIQALAMSKRLDADDGTRPLPAQGIFSLSGTESDP
jgi:hypothetical protein